MKRMHRAPGGGIEGCERAPPQQTYDRNLLKKDIRANKFNIIWQVKSACRDMIELARAVEGAESVGL